jgi:hypothetical protein
MTALSDELKIIAMAHTLGVHDGDRVEGIRDYCRRKVKSLMAGVGPINSIEELERIVCEKLHITIVEVWNDDDLAAVIEKYARQEKDIAFAGLRKELTEETFATLVQRKQNPGDKHFNYVAVVDCRGPKGARRFFSRWHEIAHVLTTVEQLQFPLHRSTRKKDPVEKMMDIVAGDIGFFEPLFAPVLKKECQGHGLSFAVVANVRQRFCPNASLEATLNACVSQAASPVILLQAEMGYKKAEERELASAQFELIPAQKPVPQLRVVSAIPNWAARKMGLLIPKHMRVPPASIITTCAERKMENQSLRADENLNWWRSSDGSALRHAEVHVETQFIRDHAWAILRIREAA